MRSTSLTVGSLALDADGICLSQTPSGAGNLTMNGTLASGGVVTLTYPNQVTITSAGNDLGRTFTIYYTTPGGVSKTKTVTGANATVATADIVAASIEGIGVDAATASSVTVGVNNIAHSKWIPVDVHRAPFNVGLGCVVSGTIDFTVQHTFDDVQDTTVTPTAFPHSSIAAKTANTDGNYAYPVSAIRVKVNSSTSGTVTLTAIQAGLTGC